MTSKASHHQQTQSKNGENYTPLEIIELVHNVLGDIDLDPASDIEANKAIKAKRIYSLKSGSLDKVWRGNTLFMNPPGGQKGYPKAFYFKAFEDFKKGSFKSGIILVYQISSLNYFPSDILEFPLCIVNPKINEYLCGRSGRICFDQIENGKRIKAGSPGTGNAFILLSHHKGISEKFKKEFSKIGIVK